MKKDHTVYHRDGSLWAKGSVLNDQPDGYWEWFRKDGTKLRSGYFAIGKQTGSWTTYDKQGEVYKVTDLTPKAKKIKPVSTKPHEQNLL